MNGIIIVLVPIVYITLQWAALARMRDGWQVAAVLPAAFMFGALLLLVVGLLTQADLAAAAVIIGLPLATAYLIVLWPLHLALHRN